MTGSAFYVPSCSSLGHFMITLKQLKDEALPIMKMLTLSRFHLLNKDVISYLAHESLNTTMTFHAFTKIA